MLMHCFCADWLCWRGRFPAGGCSSVSELEHLLAVYCFLLSTERVKVTKIQAVEWSSQRCFVIDFNWLPRKDDWWARLDTHARARHGGLSNWLQRGSRCVNNFAVEFDNRPPPADFCLRRCA
jgi:hypothetical protein